MIFLKILLSISSTYGIESTECISLTKSVILLKLVLEFSNSTFTIFELKKYSFEG